MKYASLLICDSNNTSNNNNVTLAQFNLLIAILCWI